MMESGDILEQSYQGDGKIKGEIDKKLELAKAVVEFERTNTFMSQDKNSTKSVDADIDTMLLAREARMRAKKAPKENNTLRNVLLGLLFVVTLPTFVIPVAIILYWGHIYKDSNGEQKHDDDTGCNPSSSSIRYYNYY
ncbi:MAG TPA: hypothetical protein PKW30_07035 [Campylobacterales bacterium]|nr:hypothetical protein [Campylobacterales bacterium]